MGVSIQLINQYLKLYLATTNHTQICDVDKRGQADLKLLEYFVIKELSKSYRFPLSQFVLFFDVRKNVRHDPLSTNVP